MSYLPDGILKAKGRKLAIISVGGIGACRLPPQYREREIVFLSDWIYPPAGDSEGDPTGQFFIITILHEIAHAICQHKSPALDALTDEEIQSLESEADSLAIGWFNQHVKLRDNASLEAIQRSEFREIVDRYASLYDDLEAFKVDWHDQSDT